MWTDATRGKYERGALRYATDLTDEEWAALAPLLAAPSSLGRPRKTDMREVMNAILYMARSGCQWRMLPGEFPPRSSVQHYFYKWRDDGTWQGVNRALLARTRKAEGRAAVATAGVIDSQSVKTPESGGPRGFDAGKKVMGRNRHIVVDTGGRLLGAVVHEADIQDRDGAPSLLAEVGAWFPGVGHIFADGAYAGPKLGRGAGDRQAQGGRLRCAAAPLGGRTHLGKVRGQPPPCEGLRGDRQERPCLAPDRQHRSLHPWTRKAMKINARLLPLIPVTQHVERRRDEFASDAGAFGVVRVQSGSATRGRRPASCPRDSWNGRRRHRGVDRATGSGALFDDVAVAGADAERGVEGGAGSNGTRTRRGSGADGRAAGPGKCRAPSVSGSRRRDGSTSARDGRAFRRRSWTRARTGRDSRSNRRWSSARPAPRWRRRRGGG